MSWGEEGLEASERDQGVIACTPHTEPELAADCKEGGVDNVGLLAQCPRLSDGTHVLGSYPLLIL